MSSGEVREDGTVVLHIRYVSCVDKSFCSKGGKVWSDTKCMLKVKSIGFIDRLVLDMKENIIYNDSLDRFEQLC